MVKIESGTQTSEQPSLLPTVYTTLVGDVEKPFPAAEDEASAPSDASASYCEAQGGKTLSSERITYNPRKELDACDWAVRIFACIPVIGLIPIIGMLEVIENSTLSMYSEEGAIQKLNEHLDFYICMAIQATGLIALSLVVAAVFGAALVATPIVGGILLVTSLVLIGLTVEEINKREKDIGYTVIS